MTPIPKNRTLAPTRSNLRLRAGLLAMVALVIAPSAMATRPATPSERGAIAAALRKLQPHSRLTAVVVSTADKEFALARWSEANRRSTDVFRRYAKRWRAVWGYSQGQRSIGMCAFVPASVAKDLVAVACPPWRELHGRIANVTERDALIAAARATNRLPSSHLTHACISRVESRWAAAAIEFRSTGGFAWFLRRDDKWTLRYESFAFTGTRPPSRIVLSLASCVGYQSAEYGG